MATLEVEQLRGALARSATLPGHLPAPLPLPDSQPETLRATDAEGDYEGELGTKAAIEGKLRF